MAELLVDIDPEQKAVAGVEAQFAEPPKKFRRAFPEVARGSSTEELQQQRIDFERLQLPSNVIICQKIKQLNEQFKLSSIQHKEAWYWRLFVSLNESKKHLCILCADEVSLLYNNIIIVIIVIIITIITIITHDYHYKYYY